MSAALYRLPDLGEGVSYAEIVDWKVAVGDVIEEEAPMLVVLTDKATMDIPAPRKGIVRHIFALANEVVNVGSPLIEIGDPDEEWDGHHATSSETRGVHVTPYLTKLAQEHGIDLGALAARGPVTEGAIREAARRAGRAVSSLPPRLLSSLPPAPLTIPPPARMPVGSIVDASASPPMGPSKRVPLRGVRRAAVEHLVRAQQIPSVTVVEEADFTMLEEIQAASGTGFIPFLIQAAISAMALVPEANAIFDDARRELVVYEQAHIGVAVQTDDGLAVPVIRDAARFTLEELEGHIMQLGAKARDGQLGIADVRGATFTITSPGHFGGLLATPLVNMPQAAILGLNRPTRRPAIVGDEVVVRTMAYITLTFDHRALDGIAAGKFLLAVRDCLSQPLEAISDGRLR